MKHLFSHNKQIVRCVIFCTLLMMCLSPSRAQTILSPEMHFGFQPGTDRMLIDYDQLTEYLKLLAEASPRVAFEQIGKSPFGRPMFVFFFSAPENIEHLPRLKTINKRLALDPTIPDEERTDLVDEGKVFVCMTLSQTPWLQVRFMVLMNRSPRFLFSTATWRHRVCSGSVAP